MLGHQAEDKITGLKGVITAMAVFLHGPTRLELTPAKIVDGRPLDAMWLDETRLKVGKQAIKPVAVVPSGGLGAEAEDPLTGFKGVVTAHVMFLNGCLRIEITPKLLKDGKPVEACAFDEQRLAPRKSKATAGGPFDGPKPQTGPTK